MFGIDGYGFKGCPKPLLASVIHTNGGGDLIKPENQQVVLGWNRGLAEEKGVKGMRSCQTDHNMWRH